MKRCVPYLLLTILLSTAHAADDRVLEVYSLMSPDAGAMVNVVESMLGDEGKVIYDKAGGRLLVLAPPSRQPDVAAALERINIPAPNVRIAVAIKETGQLNESGFSIRGSGEVVVTPDDTDASLTLSPSLHSRSGTRDRNVTQSLLVQSGGDAIIRVGTTVPFLDWIMTYGRHRGVVTGQIDYRDVGAQLRVHARVIGDGPLISLKLTPELSGLTDAGKQTIAFTTMSTDLTVNDGQVVTIGGMNDNSEFYEKFLVGMDRRGNRRELTITATPTIEHLVTPKSR